VNLKIWLLYDSNYLGPNQCQIDNEFSEITEAFALQGITINICSEVYIDDALSQNPRAYINMSSPRDPNRFDLLLHTEDVIGGGGQACGVPFAGDDCAVAALGSAVHEIGHMFSLWHTFADGVSFGCVSEIPGGQNWQVGDPYSFDNTGDRVADTPVHSDPRAYGYYPWPTSPSDCIIDWSSLEDPCTGNAIYPENYSSSASGYHPILESNPMSYLYSNENVCGGKVFTVGQGDRMKDFLSNNYPENQGSAPSCPVTTTLDNSINSASGPISGVLSITTDIEITSDVVINNAIINVTNNSYITISPGASLTCNNVRFMASCQDKWGGIVAKDGSTLNLNEVVIDDARIGIDLMSLSADLSNVIFVRCNTGLKASGQTSKSIIHAYDLSFIVSPIVIENFQVRFYGARLNRSEVTINGGSARFGYEGASQRASFFDSSINHDGDFLGFDHCHLDSDSEINFINGGLLQVCWSYLENGDGEAKINMQNVGKHYEIYGNIFTGGGNYIHKNSGGSNLSIVNNNIFDTGDNDFVSMADVAVETSCNFHENTLLSYTTPDGFFAQGSDRHPAGNIFETKVFKDIDPESPFDYYYNDANSDLEKPKLENIDDLFLFPIPVNRNGSCKTKEEIIDAGDWDTYFQVICWNGRLVNVTSLNYSTSEICGCPPPPPPPPLIPISIECVGCPVDDGGKPVGRATSHNSIADSQQHHSAYKKDSEVLEIRSLGQKIEINNNYRSNLLLNLYTVAGQQVISETIMENLNKIQIDHLGSGIYIAVITDLNGALIKKQTILNIK